MGTTKQMVKAGDQFISIMIRSYDEKFLYCTVLGYDKSNHMVKFIGFNKKMEKRREVKLVSISDLVFTESIKDMTRNPEETKRYCVPSDCILDEFNADRITASEMKVLLRRSNEQKRT